MYNTNQLQPPRTSLDELPSQCTSEFSTLVSTLPESPKQQPELPIPGTSKSSPPCITLLESMEDQNKKGITKELSPFSDKYSSGNINL